MGGSWRIGTFWGIPLKVHWTFSLLLVYILIVGRMEGLSGMAMLWFFLLFLALFICVILHEYGHALAARGYGVRTADILILPVGGLARLEKLPERPIQELVVAIAGPAVNLVILMIGLGYLWLSGTGFDALWQLQSQPQPSPSNLIPQLILINGALFTFNLVPAFPMDGGRILRSLLAMVMPKIRATEWATRIGMVVSAIFILLGISSGNLILAFVGIVVLYLAQTENRAVRMMEDIKVAHAEDLAERDFIVMDDWRTVGDAIDRINGQRVNVIVVRDTFGESIGYIRVRALGVSIQDRSKALYQVMETLDAGILSGSDMKTVIRFFRERKDEALPVIKNGQLLGLIYREKVLPYSALEQVS